MLRRTQAARFVTEGSGRAFTVEIARAGDHYVGHLRGAQASDSPNARSFEDADCVEVARSLSLVLTLAIDPEAALALPPLNGRKSPPAHPAPQPQPKPKAKKKSQRRIRPGPLRAQPQQPSRSAVRPPRPSQFSLGALAFVQTGIASKVLVGAGPSARLRLPQLGALAPSIALEGLAAQTAVVGPEPQEANYRWLAVRALLAPVSIQAGRGILLYPSFLSDLGAVTGTGRSIASPQTDTGFWASSGVGLGFSARLSRRLWLDALANVEANFTRHRFVFQRPFMVVHEIPAASFGASLGLSWRL